MKSFYDVIVVGAGPAGSVLASEVCCAGFSAILLEKRPVIGEPVRCGEATGNREEIERFMQDRETIEVESQFQEYC